MFKKWFGKNNSAQPPAEAESAKRSAHSAASKTEQSSASTKVDKKQKQQGSGSRRNAAANGGSNRGRRSNQRQRKIDEQPPWQLDQFKVEAKPGFTRFHDLDLQLPLMRAIADLGFEYCSPIQAAVLPHTLDGYDAVGKAQTGTGKTAAFLLTAINDLLENPIEGERYTAEPRVVVIAPTRELTMQIGKDAEDLVKHTSLRVETLIGGMDYARQLDKIKRHIVDIVVIQAIDHCVDGRKRFIRLLELIVLCKDGLFRSGIFQSGLRFSL